MTWRDLRLVPVAAVAWGAAAFATMVPAVSVWAATTSWMLVAGVIIGGWIHAAAVTGSGAPRRAVRRRERRTPGVLLAGPAFAVITLTLVAGAAAASHVALAQPARGAAGELSVSGGRAIEVTAVMTGKAERWSSGAIVFDAVASAVRIGPAMSPVAVDIQVRTSSETAVLAVGSTMRVEGTARAADPGDRAVLVVTASRSVEVVHGPSGILAVASWLRADLLDAVDGLPEPGAGLLPGLAVGDTSIVDPALDGAMKASSLSHLTAVSGANCAIVVGLAFAVAAAAGASRSARVVIALVALGGFVVLVTPEPSVVRAGVMASVAMLAVLLGRPGAGLSVLALSVAVLLITDPWLSTSLGFALSVAATASLLLFARPLAAGLAHGMPRALALALSVPLAAQLACGPLLVLIEPSVPIYGVVANLLAGPAAPLATIVGLAACLAAPLPWLQSGLTAIAWLPAAWIAGTATTFAGLPGAQVPWLGGLGGLLALTAVGLAIGVVVSRRGPQRLRRAIGALLALTVGVLCGFAALDGVAGRLTLPHDWSVLACDVGQGDAVLVRSAGRTALIDTGPDPAVLSTCLERAGVERIDLLVLTHFDLDHVGGIEAVSGQVTTVIHGPPASAADVMLLDRLDAGDTVPAAAGMHGALGDSEWRIVWPRRESRAFPTGNDASVVVEFSGGGVPHSLFLGDLSASPQRALAASGSLNPPYALVKIAHHGSADQDAALYRLLEPSVALVTVGADNDYAHPREEALVMAREAGARIARTDLEGVVAVTSTATGIRIWRERDVAADR